MTLDFLLLKNVINFWVKRIYEMFPTQNILRCLPNATKERLAEYRLKSNKR